MKLGLLVGYNDDDLAVLKRIGFRSCELLIFPDNPLSPSLGATADDWKRARDRFAAMDVEVSAIGSYTNNLNPDLKQRKADLAHLERLFDVADAMGVRMIGTFAGRDPEKDIPDNIPAFKEVFGALTACATDRGKQIVIENCPMFHGFPFRGINIAYTPEAWQLMFDAVPSPALGLEYDPSHLVCLGIDYMKVIFDFAERIYHVHVKDAEVLQDKVNQYGILDGRSVRHRMPGYGDVDWRRVISALREINYSSNLDIEGRHDPVFHGESEEEGLILAANHLRQFVA
jgi:sugar phosphate isomerase/epimerase